MRAQRGEFSKVFWRCLWVPGDWTEENSMSSVRRTRNSVRRILVSTVEAHIGSCWRISVSHDQAGHHVRQVPRAAPSSHQVHEHAELVDYAEPDRKQVQALEDWSEVFPRSCSCNKPGSRILNTLKWINHIISNPNLYICSLPKWRYLAYLLTYSI